MAAWTESQRVFDLAVYLVVPKGFSTVEETVDVSVSLTAEKQVAQMVFQLAEWMVYELVDLMAALKAVQLDSSVVVKSDGQEVDKLVDRQD